MCHRSGGADKTATDDEVCRIDIAGEWAESGYCGPESDGIERHSSKLYHTEIEILDMHGDLAEADVNEGVRVVLAGHKRVTVDLVDCNRGLVAEVRMTTTEISM